jgi:hypothetical protein
MRLHLCHMNWGRWGSLCKVQAREVLTKDGIAHETVTAVFIVQTRVCSRCNRQQTRRVKI